MDKYIELKFETISVFHRLYGAVMKNWKGV